MSDLESMRRRALATGDSESRARMNREEIRRGAPVTVAFVAGARLVVPAYVIVDAPENEPSMTFIPDRPGSLIPNNIKDLRDKGAI